MIVSAFDAVMDETREIRGKVWASSVDLIKHAMSQ